jgi:superfamily I DNA and/or RNA helicase
MSANDHFVRLARLLDLEGEAEAEQVRERRQRLTGSAAERRGECLLDLVLTDESSGLGGRCLLTFVKRNRTQHLPWTRLAVGSPVLVCGEEQTTSLGKRGVICERRDGFLRVAVNEPPDDESATYRIDLAGDEAARLRQKAALDRASRAKRDRLAELRTYLLGEAVPRFAALPDLALCDNSLNESQREAVRFALAARDLAILHGPPGTGKTTTVVELIRQAIRRGHKVLACAPSNLAVDNLLERLAQHGEKALRLGHPARVLPTLREHTLDLLVEEHDDVRLARKLAKEAYALFRKAKKFTRAKPEPGMRQDLRREGRALLADARQLENRAVEKLLDRATVLCATLTGLDDSLLADRHFDLLVIDEACQSTEPACWIALARCERVVLAGDHCQLPPTVISRPALDSGLGVSLLERLVTRFGAQATRRLQVQYRMHEAIMAFSARWFYEDDLHAYASVAHHLLSECPEVAANELTTCPIHFIDTAGASFDEEREAEGEGDSKFNPQEAALVASKVDGLLTAGVSPADIAVIAPYAAHVRLLRELLRVPGLEIDSVDGFQGREKEAVIVSLVRSNLKSEIGFLADVRRMNVALTRARRKLIVVGDSATLAVHKFYKELFAYFEQVGAHHSVWEEL